MSAAPPEDSLAHRTAHHITDQRPRKLGGSVNATHLVPCSSEQAGAATHLVPLTELPSFLRRGPQVPQPTDTTDRASNRLTDTINRAGTGPPRPSPTLLEDPLLPGAPTLGT
jgi:hypothetical protein